MVDWLFSNLTPLSVGLFLMAVSVSITADHLRSNPVSLESCLARGLSLSTAPTGLALTISAFDPSLLTKIEGQAISFGVAGISLLFIGIKHSLPR